MNVWFYAIHVSSIMCKYSSVVIVLIKENFGPFTGEILAGVFTRSRGKNAHPLGHWYHHHGNQYSNLLWHSFVLFFNKAWIYHSIASETYFISLLNLWELYLLLRLWIYCDHFLFFREKVKIAVEAIKFSTSS